MQYGRDSGKLARTAKGASQRYTQQYSNASYTSGWLHHVKLDHLLPSTTYYYRWAFLCFFSFLALGPFWSFWLSRRYLSHLLDMAAWCQLDTSVLGAT